MKRPWILLLLCLVSAAPASAQFTTFIAPPTPVKDSIKAAVAAGQRSAADSITRAQITAMKTWVDSAAGVPSVVRPADSARLQDSVTPAVKATVVSNGVVAPETASQLPFLLAAGGAAMLIGLLLLWRPQTAPRRIDR